MASQKNYNFSKIEYFFDNRIFFLGKFKRKFDLCLSLPSFKLIKSFYQDQYLEEFYTDKIRKYFFINFNLKLLAIFFFFFSKKTYFFK